MEVRRVREGPENVPGPFLIGFMIFKWISFHQCKKRLETETLPPDDGCQEGWKALSGRHGSHWAVGDEHEVMEPGVFLMGILTSNPEVIQNTTPILTRRFPFSVSPTTAPIVCVGMFLSTVNAARLS